MKLRFRSGSAALETPEGTPAPEADQPVTSVHETQALREPAPAGAFQRGRFHDEEASYEEEPYVPRRGEQMKFNWRTSVPKSVGGRIVALSGGLLILGAFTVALAAVRHSLLHDERFTIATSSDIEISGNEHLTRGQLLSVFGADLERNIFKVPLAERRADLERLPWVQHATVMRLLPNHLRIAITERTPVAFVRQGTQLGLVDATGVLLDMPSESAGDPHYSFPVLTGLNPEDQPATRAARMAVYAKFMKELGGNDDAAKSRTDSLSEVDVSNPEDVKALVASGGSDILVHFGDEQFLERYNEFQQHLPEWRSQYPKLASADMRYERQVVLEMAKGADVPSGAPAAAPEAKPAPVAAPAPGTSSVAKAAPRPVAHPVAHPAHEASRAVISHKLMAEKLARARAAAGKHVPPTHPSQVNQ